MEIIETIRYNVIADEYDISVQGLYTFDNGLWMHTTCCLISQRHGWLISWANVNVMKRLKINSLHTFWKYYVQYWTHKRHPRSVLNTWTAILDPNRYFSEMNCPRIGWSSSTSLHPCCQWPWTRSRTKLNYPSPDSEPRMDPDHTTWSPVSSLWSLPNIPPCGRRLPRRILNLERLSHRQVGHLTKSTNKLSSTNIIIAQKRNTIMLWLMR